MKNQTVMPTQNKQNLPLVVQNKIRIVDRGDTYVIQLFHQGRWTPSFAFALLEEAVDMANTIRQADIDDC